MPNNAANKTNSPSSDTSLKSTPKSRKRKRSTSSDEDDSEMDESATAIEKKLRSVAKMNNLSQLEMRKLIRKLVANDHVLAFISLKAEDEIAREKDEADKLLQAAAVIVNDDNPLTPKFTRAKARQLNKPPMIALPSLMEPQASEMATLIQQDLHSDEDDEEYTFKEEDFISDEDQNMTASDIDSQPRTPMTPNQVHETESPQKFSEDGVFKIPRDIETDNIGDELIATRTRSKFCLQETTIEDIQSEFEPPDDHLDMTDTELYGNDQEWMDFLNTFSKPLNNSIVGDDDDPVNDPEYIAAEKIPIDAEELRDINISKKELTELVAELFEGLLNEGVSLESIELETPKKFVENNKSTSPKDGNSVISPITPQMHFPSKTPKQISDETISSSNLNPTEFSFYPNVMSTPQTQAHHKRFPTGHMHIETKHQPCTSMMPTSDAANVSTAPFKLSYTDPSTTTDRVIYLPSAAPAPIINTQTDQWCTDRYIAAQRILKNEYANKFETFISTNVPDVNVSKEPVGFTSKQYQILRQQLMIHVQFCTQNIFQTYSHPDLWKFAPQQKQYLLELEEKSRENSTFDVWNLKPALKLVHDWEIELQDDSEENAKLMKFIYKEIRRVERTHNQLSRFSPRIMKKLLSSPVFMFPEYLPRLPFTGHQISFHLFAPGESFLIAMGLEKHLNEILANELNFSYMKRRRPLSVACERMMNTIIHGKTPRRMKDHINDLKSASGYNPVKYYFEYQKAPPAEHKLVYIDFNNVLPPQQRVAELPKVWKEFLQVLNAGGIKNNTYPENYTRYVKDIAGEIIDFPSCRVPSFGFHRSVKWAQRHASKEKENEQPNVTININYVFGQAPEKLPEFNESQSNLLEIPEYQPLSDNRSTRISSPVKDAPIISPTQLEGQRKVTDYFNSSTSESRIKSKTPEAKTIVNNTKRRYKSAFPVNRFSSSYLGKKFQTAGKKFRLAKHLQKRCDNLLSAYRLSLENQFARYNNRGLRFLFRNCKALELYTNLLRDLKMNCKKIKPNDDGSSKRKVDEQDAPKSRKANRQEENFRHMLCPDRPEDANRKDAIYAFNFYEKVEEVLKLSKRPDDCKKFNHILRSFDPKKDNVADLYCKLEKLFLPDHPELAHVFLTFLLPPEAAQVGKFFEHFMYTNAGTFFNKLNVYFNKQPAQIRKIFNCINDLSEDPDVTVDKMKSKIFPLLKGNTFLIDWFTQLFSSEAPPDRLLGSAETTNMKEVLSNHTGDYIETLHPSDILDSPTESQTCQLKYINGRIFYGTKIPLPAKLSFMAKSYKADELNDAVDDGIWKNSSVEGGCVHGIREYGEKRLSVSMNDSSDDNEKSEEEDPKAQLVPIVEEQHFETCDDANLRAHAIRLNPSYYATSCYSTSQASTGNTCHRPLKITASMVEDGKGSPRKAISKVNLPLSANGSVSTAFKERRKSPKKNSVKSPLSTSKRAMTEGTGKSNAIATAKKLRNLIDEETNADTEANKKKLPKKRKENDGKPNEESEGSDNEQRLSPKKEIKQEPIQPWTRDEDKIILEEIKCGFKDHQLYERINSKLTNRTLLEIEERHKFLMDFLSKLQSSK